MIVIDTPQTLGCNLSSDDEDMLVTEFIAQLQKLIDSIPENQTNNVKKSANSTSVAPSRHNLRACSSYSFR
jgi:hypothetical protein